MNSSIDTKALSEEDWDILSQCLIAAVEGPFLKGLFFSEAEMPSLLGANWDQLCLIQHYWPDLDTFQLHAEYEKIDMMAAERAAAYRLKVGPRPGQHPEQPQYMRMPTRLRIFSVVDHCLYLLDNYMPGSPDTDKRKRALMAWNGYVNVTPQRAHLAIERWWRHYRTQRLKDGD